MFPGDVLVSIVGTIGSVGLVTDRHGKLTGSCKLAIIRPHALPAEYVAVYLASRPGQNEIERRIRGAVQMGLILPDMKEIPVPIPDNGL
jgi:restriction endonuclease S subunit